VNTPNPARPPRQAAWSASRRAVASPTPKPAKLIPSSSVFGGETEIGIEHHGELYRLRITRQGKLILTK